MAYAKDAMFAGEFRHRLNIASFLLVHLSVNNDRTSLVAFHEFVCLHATG